jgi:UDP-N-acetylglucosamine--N-acetylmuramyl-(pentapeptide) pyrophosphoryl-undecaprenol N-acetylglucosamine transferase
MSGQTVLFAGGGSGGHLYPGLAVAAELAKIRPDLTPLFLCTEREIDRVILEPTGFAFRTQPVVPPARSVGGLLRFWQAWRHTAELVRRTLAEHEVVAILGLGGYAAGPSVRIGTDKRHRKLAAILNPDVVPGKANHYLMPKCRRVYCGFAETVEHVAVDLRERCVVTGCPLRPDVIDRPPREEAVQRLGLDPRLNTLVVTGASQGASTVNAAVVEVARRSDNGLQGWQVLHLSGRDHAEAVRADWRSTELGRRVVVVDFTPAMADVWAVADLAVSRAGASTCFELLAAGVPAIFLPYPFHKDKHQEINGRAVESAGAGVVLEDLKETRPNGDALEPILNALLYDAARRREMAEAAKKAARPDAAKAVAADLVQHLATSSDE